MNETSPRSDHPKSTPSDPELGSARARTSFPIDHTYGGTVITSQNKNHRPEQEPPSIDAVSPEGPTGGDEPHDGVGDERNHRTDLSAMLHGRALTSVPQIDDRLALREIDHHTRPQVDTAGSKPIKLLIGEVGRLQALQEEGESEPHQLGDHGVIIP